MEGLHKLTSVEYHADPCGTPSLSSSIAKAIYAQSPLHAWTKHPKLNPNYVHGSASESMELGTVIHALILEGTDNITIVDADNWRTNAAKAERDEARDHGTIALLRKDYDRVSRLIESVRRTMEQFAVSPALFGGNGAPEQTLTWVEEGGVQCRALLDWLHDDRGTVDDLKTTGLSAAPEAWSRSLIKNGYDIQAAFYLRGLRALFGDADREFRFVVVETTEPFAVSVFGLSPDALRLADAKVEFAVRKWRQAISSGVWEGYPSEVCYVESPAFDQVAFVDREVRDRGV